MNSSAICCHAFSYDDAGQLILSANCAPCCWVQKYSSFEYLHIYSAKSGDFCRKK